MTEQLTMDEYAVRNAVGAFFGSGAGFFLGLGVPADHNKGKWALGTSGSFEYLDHIADVQRQFADQPGITLGLYGGFKAGEKTKRILTGNTEAQKEQEKMREREVVYADAESVPPHKFKAFYDELIADPETTVESVRYLDKPRSADNAESILESALYDEKDWVYFTNGEIAEKETEEGVQYNGRLKGTLKSGCRKAERRVFGSNPSLEITVSAPEDVYEEMISADN